MARHRVAWWSASVQTLSAHALDELTTICSSAELARAERFVFARDRCAYLAAHGLLRLALSASVPAYQPAEWLFSAGAYGRPELHAQMHSCLRFNLSHCASRVTCVVCAELDCGVDVEPLGRHEASPAMQASCLAPSELARIDMLTDIQRAAMFIRFWTLKEALSKAVGKGLGLPFQQLAFELDPKPAVRAVPAEAAGPWWLAHRSTTDGHIESLALRVKEGDEVDLLRHEWGNSGPKIQQAHAMSVLARPLAVG
ncbi:4'-phosphopantetheinyl transferase superfamily protein [Paraburkholderia jirisanensis]